MKRETLERHQVWYYLGAVLLGLLAGILWPASGQVTETLVWPVLTALLYATFSQMRITAIPAAFKDGRFLLTALVGNFMIIPLVVFGLVNLTPDDQPVRLGLLLVLLVPCTDWFITFTQLGRGDVSRATVFTPLALILQLLLLPLYLWLMTDIDVSRVFAPADVWPAVFVVIAPLVLAARTQRWATRKPAGQRLVQGLGWAPVPLLALVMALIAAGHAGDIQNSVHLLPIVVSVAAGFLATSLVIAKILSLLAGLPNEQGRTLAFSLGTRNSFIVLPFALTLPAGWEVAAMVIVLQSLVELFGMIFYLWFVPRVLFQDAS